jgi:hypothetical protein
VVYWPNPTPRPTSENRTYVLLMLWWVFGCVHSHSHFNSFPMSIIMVIRCVLAHTDTGTYKNKPETSRTIMVIVLKIPLYVYTLICVSDYPFLSHPRPFSLGG